MGVWLVVCSECVAVHPYRKWTGHLRRRAGGPRVLRAKGGLSAHPRDGRLLAGVAHRHVATADTRRIPRRRRAGAWET